MGFLQMAYNQSVVPDHTLLVGCGQVGTQLGERLNAAGSQITALRRDPSDLPSSFTRLSIDLMQPVSETLPEVDSMVVTLTPTMLDPAGENGYLKALQHFAHALPNVPSRVVFVSSTRVFEGHSMARPLTEDDPVAPTSHRGETLVAGEQLAVELFGAHVVRPAGIYGPGREMLIRKVLANEAVQYNRLTNRIHQTDLVNTLYAILSANAPPAVLHAIDQAPGVPLGDIVEYIASQLHVAVPPALEQDGSRGRILGGDRLHTWLGPLDYPTYREGYDSILAGR